MAYPSVTYTFSNSTTADATQVNQNFTDLINGLSDGTKDLSISALTVAGTATLNGAITLGNATTDDITITGYLASSFIPKTNQTYDIGTPDLGLRALYLGVASAGALTAKVIASASIAADRIYTMPEAGTDASFVMTAGTQTISGAKTFDTAGNAMKGITSGSALGAGYIGEKLSHIPAALTGSTSLTQWATVTLTAGIWLVIGTASCDAAAGGTYLDLSINTITASLSGTTFGYDRIIIGVNATNGSGASSLVITKQVSSSTPIYLNGGTNHTAGSGIGASLVAVRIA